MRIPRPTSVRAASGVSTRLAPSLFAVLILARLLTLGGGSIAVSVWTPVAYLWQDLLAALIFAFLESFVLPRRAGWLLYSTLVSYVALNVPITLVLSSPLTPAMIRAAGGPLLDSIRHHLTLANLGALALVASAGVLFPLLLTRMQFQLRKGLAVASLALVAVGPFATGKVETVGLHRNAFGALMPVGAVYDRIAADTRHASDTFRHDGWRVSPFESARSVPEIAQYRGAAAGRNVVVVILESTAAGYLRPYGAQEDPMPNLTGLASRSIVFEDAYAVYPESIKGLFSVLCSRYPAFATPAEAYSQVPCASLAQLLTDAGYATALFHSGRFMYLGMEQVLAGRGFGRLEDAGDIGGVVNSSFGVDEPSTVQRILEWVDSAPKDKPFFIKYLPVAGHHPYASPQPGPFAADTETGRYLNALHYADDALGQLLRGFRDRGLEDKTAFVIFGDHGEAFGQHGLNFGHSLFIYDENVRVPYVIAAPGLIRAPVRVTATASLIDTAPTILDLLGIPLHPEFQGNSLLAGPPGMALFFTDYSLPWLGLRDDCWKYIYEMDSRRSKLFDVCRDPGELDDKSAREGERVQVYRSRLLRWIGVF